MPNFPFLFRLNSVSLGTAVPYYTRSGRSTYVEHCLCPEGYHGLSCEVCRNSFTKNAFSILSVTFMLLEVNKHNLGFESFSVSDISCLFRTCDYIML